MPADGFFDDFKAPAADEAALFSEEDFQRLRALFLESGLPLDELQARYRAALDDILAAKGHAIEWAQEHHGSYPFVAAYSSAEELAVLRDEAAAAAVACKGLTEREEWVPPPPDEEPERLEDE
ncbi:hypothetical protein Rsub_12879 [Raphidocelis subcapitata]|uniref:Uncharacterized protein n=1 Tax=Raphidocelis subcapitata TaxID=307507 RepID=A0A2V0PKB2_9CHLO|nr:hypothetical protein Rsub_12879 [Raphidocelis subcapitata]|eukprot:GBG00235.1 hypothetical protein Rsub_12879 [Raphidocelis subcapitata]